MTLSLSAPLLALSFAAAQSVPPEGTQEEAPTAEAAPAEAPLQQTPAAEPQAAPPSKRETKVVSQRPLDLRRVAGSAHLITREELEQHEYNDVHRVLQRVPGVYLRDEDGYGLRPNIGLRGAMSDRSSKVTLLEDGVLFSPAPYAAPAAYYFPLVTRMDAVEVYKGPASIKYGPNTIGGAINFRTRRVPYQTEGMLDVGFGSYRTNKVHGYLGHGDEKVGLLVEGVHLGSTGFKRLDGGGDTGFEKNELMGKLRLGSSGARFAGGQLELKLGYADERSNETYLGLTDDDFRQHPLRRYAASQKDQMRWTRTQAELSHSVELGPVTLRGTGYRHDFHRAWFKLNRFASGPALSSLLADPDGGPAGVLVAILRGDEDSQGPSQALMVGTNDRTFVSQGVQLRGEWVVPGVVEQQFDFGVRLHHDEIERLHDEDSFAMVNGVLVPDGRPTLINTSNNGYARALAMHVQDELAWGRLLVVPGARLELIETGFIDRLSGRFQENRSTVPLLGLGAVYQVTPGFSVLAGAHEGFSPVSPGQPDEVQPERSVNYEAGARYRSRGLQAELIGFLNDYYNLTGECTLSSGCEEDLLNRQFNGGAVHVYGLEAAVGVERPTPLRTRTGLEVTYTLTRSRFLNSFLSDAPQFGAVEEGDQLPFVPEHQGSVRLRLSGDAWSFAILGAYQAAMRERAGQGAIPTADRTDPRLVVDLAAHHNVGERGEVYLTVTNLLNSQYLASRRPYGARPGAPLQAMAGFKVRFE